MATGDDTSGGGGPSLEKQLADGALLNEQLQRVAESYKSQEEYLVKLKIAEENLAAAVKSGNESKIKNAQTYLDQLKASQELIDVQQKQIKNLTDAYIDQQAAIDTLGGALGSFGGNSCGLLFTLGHLLCSSAHLFRLCALQLCLPGFECRRRLGLGLLLLRSNFH